MYLQNIVKVLCKIYAKKEIFFEVFIILVGSIGVIKCFIEVTYTKL